MFISHTSELRDFPGGTSYVAAVERAISAAGHVIVDMREFPASDQPTAQVCAERVRGCEVYVGVLGTRYGSPVRDKPEVSYTELEFDTATEARLDRLMFLLDTDAQDVGIPPSALIDREFGARQDAFRRRVRDTGLTTRYFANPAALGQLVERSLRELAETRRRIGRGITHEQVVGRPLDEVTDPFALEVHRPVQLEDSQIELPALPAYVLREHDMELGSVVRAAAEGSSGIAALVGGSSTGKTRACWEALQPLRDEKPEWRLWHPIDPSRPDAALRELPSIGPRTVVWLNEAQFYLDVADDGLGERVAAGLRELLRDSARAPVLVLATLWPEFWNILTARPASGTDPHAQARELLAGRDITVPTVFTAAQMQPLSEAGDARLVQASAAAEDGHVIQFLAGAPELLARYRNAPPSAAALIQAAMDARRLGMGPELPQTFLEAATPAYLTDAEWDAVGEDWLEQALAYTAVPCKGVRGPLTRIRFRPAQSRTTRPGYRHNDEQLTGGQASIAGVLLYRLADYLDQHGRHYRKSHFPPAGFWAAAADHAFPSDQAALGDAAHARGLYRTAAQLHKNAAARGNRRAVFYLSNTPDYLRADIRPVSWAAANVSVDDPGTVTVLLHSLREAGAQEQVTALAARAAAHVSLDDLSAVARLLGSLREAGAQEHVTALADRAAAHASLNNPYAIAGLLDSLREAGAQEQVTALADRAAAHASLDDLGAVAWLLGSLRRAGAQEQVTALADRAAAHASLDDPDAVAELLGRLRRESAQEQVTALADRDPAAHVSLDDPGAVGRLLRALRAAGVPEQVTALADRAAAHVSLDDPGAVGWLLRALRAAGAQRQVTALADRDPVSYLYLDNPDAVAGLLDSLREAGAEEQVTALLHRNPAAHVSLHNAGAVARLLDSLREAAAQQQVTVLADRAAACAPLDNPDAVARLLDSLREAAAQEQVTVLADRAAAYVSPADPDAVAGLLDSLRKAGAEEQVTALLHRDPAAHVSLHNPGAVARLLDSLRGADAQEQVTVLAARAAACAPLDNLGAVRWLLDSLREASADEQVTVLCGRLPGEGMFELFRGQQARRDRFRFGREADGSPADPWGWEDLD